MIAAINYDFDQLITDDIAYIDQHALIAEAQDELEGDVLGFQYLPFAETPMFAQL